ncbi:MAG: FKBP-type peptidyl-prolyl cis-trans isomerase [Desulfotalea sp.]
MKRKILVAALGLCLVAPFAAQSADKKGLEKFEDKLGYSVGNEIGTSLVDLKGYVNFESIVKGMKDGFNGKDPLLTKEEIMAVQKEFVSKRLEEMKAKNKKEGLAFLAENKKKKGVVVTKSGLQYQILEKGKGAKPKADDVVVVDYVGQLIDGKEFDSSISRGTPATFPVNQVIAGWTEALQLLPVGSKARLVIPSELAYGDNGAPPTIEPNAVLVFEVTLHSIEAKAKVKPAPEKAEVKKEKK